jgi:hypothetical protein
LNLSTCTVTRQIPEPADINYERYTRNSSNSCWDNWKMRMHQGTGGRSLLELLLASFIAWLWRTGIFRHFCALYVFPINNSYPVCSIRSECSTTMSHKARKHLALSNQEYNNSTQVICFYNASDYAQVLVRIVHFTYHMAGFLLEQVDMSMGSLYSFDSFIYYFSSVIYYLSSGFYNHLFKLWNQLQQHHIS